MCLIFFRYSFLETGFVFVIRLKERKSLVLSYAVTMFKVNFDVSLTVNLSITLATDQLDAQIFNTFITVLYMYMFRATSCSSSGGQIVLTLRRLMSYIYMEHPFLMFLDHTQRRSTVGRTPMDE